LEAYFYFSLGSQAASIAGLVLSCYVAWRVRDIHNTYISTIRAPQLLKELSKRRQDFSSAMNQFPEKRRIALNEASRIQVIVKSLSEKLGKQIKAERKSVLGAIGKLEHSHDRHDFDKLYSLLLSFEEAAKHSVADSQVRKKA